MILYLEQVKLFAVLVVSFWCNIWTSRPFFTYSLPYIPEFYIISTCLRYFKYCFSSNSILLIICTWKACLLSRLFKSPYMTLTLIFFVIRGLIKNMSPSKLNFNPSIVFFFSLMISVLSSSFLALNIGSMYATFPFPVAVAKWLGQVSCVTGQKGLNKTGNFLVHISMFSQFTNSFLFLFLCWYK